MPTHGRSIRISPHMPHQEGNARCLVHPNDSGSDVPLLVSPVPGSSCTLSIPRRSHETESSRAYAEDVGHVLGDLHILMEWTAVDPKPLARHRHAPLAVERQTRLWHFLL